MRRIHDSPARSLAAGALFLFVFDGRVMAQTAPKLPIEIVPTIGHSESVWELWAGLDGRVLLSVDGISKTTKLWDRATGSLLRTWNKDNSSRQAVALAPDGRSVVAFTGRYGATNLQRWDVASGALVSTVATDLFSAARNIALSPDGKLISASGSELRLIDTTSGRTQFLLDKSRAYSVAFSPDGRRLASGSENGMKLWDTANGQLVGMFAAPKGYSRYAPVTFSPGGQLGASIAMEGKQQRVLLWNATTAAPVLTLDAQSAGGFYALAFAPDGKTIAVAGEEDAITIWDVASGHLVRSIPFRCARAGDIHVTPLVFVRDGVLASAVACENSIRLWNTSTGELIRTFEGLSSIEQSGISPDGRTIVATNPRGGIKLFDAASGRLARVLAVDGGREGKQVESGMSFSNDGTKLATHDGESIKIWETGSWRLLRDLGAQPAHIDAMRFSPDGRSFASGYNDYDADKQKAKTWYRLWDVNSGRSVRNSSAVQLEAGGTGLLAYAPDGKSLVFASPTGFDLFDTASGRRLRSFRVPKEFDVMAEPDSLLFWPDGRTVLSTQQNLVLLWDVASAKLIRKMEVGTLDQTVALSPDAHILATTEFDAIKLWDPATGQLLRTLTGNGYVASLNFSRDGRQLVAASLDGTIRYWRTDTGELLATLAAIDGDHWLVITPEGFFDSSRDGVGLVNIVRGLDVWSVDQFYQSLYRPDLVAEKIAGDPRGLVREAAAKLDLDKVIASGNAPSLVIASPRDGASAGGELVAVGVTMTERGGGIGRIEWRVNGVTVGVENRAAAPPATAGASVTVSRSVPLDAGDNDIAVVAYNARNLVASVPARVRVAGQAPASTAKPRLFVLAAGINDYADPRFRLAFAVPDANALVDALGAAGKGLYESVKVTVLRDADVRRDKLQTAFATLAKEVRATDVFTLYLSGHGKTVDGRYYFIPQDFALGEDRSAASVNPAVVKQGIDQEQWQAWFAAIQARKSVLLFDTCEAGTLTGEGRETELLERGAGSNRLVQATGRSILTASSGDTEALEGYHGHGLFTYQVLQALERADTDGNGTVDVVELAAYVRAEVAALSERVFKQRQVPQVQIIANYPFATATRVLADADLGIVIPAQPTHQIAASADLLVEPSLGARRVRTLEARTPVTLVNSEAGWTLVASGGRPLGYVATRDLVPIQ